MNLYEGLPYWLVKDQLWNYYNPLRRDQKIRVAIIGSGITGALVANELCEAGIECCVVDRRSVATGSSVASTALLQYEIDIPLCRMAEMMPEQDAVTAFRSCLDAIDTLGKILKDRDIDAGFARVPSVFYASNRKGLELIEEEYEIRRKYDLPVEFLDKKLLRNRMGIKASGALMNYVSGEVDAYRAAQGLLSYNMKKHNLKVFTHTDITDWERLPEGYNLRSSDGHTLMCDHVIVAAGFEAGPFLPSQLMELTSTFAIISQPVDNQHIWHGRSLIWETREPYLYIRTDDSNRIIVGGEDVPHDSPVIRKRLLERKAAILERKFRKLYPEIPFKTEMSWAGTFSSTRDGLPIIGATSDDPRMLFALGYGGNGITFSVIAAQILEAELRGDKDPRAHIFSPERDSLRKSKS